MNFGEILAKSWKIIWKNKILWLFGLLAGCGAGGGGGGGGSRFNMGNSQGFNNLPPELQQFGNQLTQFFQNIPFWVYPLVIGLFCVLFVAILFLSALGRAGLMRGAWLADEGHPRLSLGVVWTELKPYYWRILLLNLLVGIAAFIVVLILLLPAIFITVVTVGIGLICLLPLICVLVLFAWLLQIIVEQAMAAIVGENLGIFAALQRAWNVSFANLGKVVLMGLILFIGNAILGLLIALPALAIIIPIAIGFASGQEAIRTGLIISLVLFCVYLPIAWFLSAVLRSYVSTAWVVTFRRLTGKGILAPVPMAPSDLPPMTINETPPPAPVEPPSTSPADWQPETPAEDSPETGQS